MRQHKLFVESGDFEEKDSEKNWKIDPIAVFFSYRLYKFFFSVLIKRGILLQFSEEISVQLSKNTIEPSFISSQMLMIAMIISEPTEHSHLKY